jgi:hypothetical protein
MTTSLQRSARSQDQRWDLVIRLPPLGRAEEVIE